MRGQKLAKSVNGKDGYVPERTGLKKGVYLLPNLITTGALFSGFYAIISALSGMYEEACIAIVIAGFLDALDGRIARLTNTTSEFGVQYDSMSDLVAFGVAPAILLFSWTLQDLGKIGWMISFLYMCCAAMRLARFNMAPDNKVFFGLASPAAAGTMTTLVWVSVDNFPPVEGIEISVSVGILTVLVALLMVCNVRYYSPKNLKGRVSFPMMLGAVLLFVVIATYPPGVLLCIGVVYGLSGPAQALIRFIRAKSH